jgi:hypothetical protein
LIRFQRSPALAPGIFLCFFIFVSHTLRAEEVFSLFGRMGSLFVRDGKASLYQQGGLSFRGGKTFHLDITANRLASDLPQAEVTSRALYYDAGLNTGPLRFDLRGGFFRHGLLDMSIMNKPFYNKGGEGFFLNPGLSLRLGDFTLRPSFLYGEAGWQEGSLYWFYGKPDLPALRLFGLEASYDAHTLGLKYLDFDMDLLNNEEELLFESRFRAVSPSYGFSRRYYDTRLAGTLGWLYAEGDVHGALTAGNQQYWLFPFLFFQVDAGLKAHALYSFAQIRHNPGFFRYSAGLGLLHILQGETNVTAHYQQKNLFGGAERWEYPDQVNLGHFGFAFLSLGAGIEPLRAKPGTSLSLSLGLEKAFIIPWGYKKFLPAGTSGGSGADSSASIKPDTRQLLTVLLSGLSLYLKTTW